MLIKKFLFSPALLFFILYISADTRGPVVIPVKPDSTNSIMLSFVGDIMCHSPQYNYAHVSGDSFDFSPAFKYVKSYLSAADYTFGNLETVIAGGKLSGYPLFNSPPQYLDAIKDAGFDFLFTSNNHCLDMGERGVLNTISELEKRTIKYTGTFTSQKDRDSIRLFSIKGLNLALLSYTYGVNGNFIPKTKKYLVNLIDTILIKEDIAKSKLLKPDIILVYFHFGEEYRREPDKLQKTIVERTISYGADCIIASHPHVIQPIDFIKKSSGIDSVFVAYSLGNFISNQRDRYKDSGVILNLLFEKNFTSKVVQLKNYSFIPTWVFKGIVNKKSEFLILPCKDALKDSAFNFLRPEDLRKIKQSIWDTEEILSR